MRRIVFKLVVLSLVLNLVLPASLFSQVLPYMPPAGTLVGSSPAPYGLPYLVGMKFSSDNIFDFTFYLNRGNTPAQEDVLRAEAEKINKYFLAALTIPEKDLWVNLSPYEQDRIITPELGRTDLGKDLLGEDYVLKQLAASLTYPDSKSGKQYWQSINGVGANNHSPVNSFTKVWIVPGTIKMKEASDRVVITEATLKVLTEEDYLAMQKNNGRLDTSRSLSAERIEANGTLGDRSSQAMRNIIVPLIEKEVNIGKHFAQLRQLYRAIIMAGWFKKKLKDTVLSQVYFNQKKIKGAENDDPALKEKIYNEYVKAFNQGVYKVVKSQHVGLKISKRQYFSGGAALQETKDIADKGTELAAPTDQAAKPAVMGQIGVVGGTSESKTGCEVVNHGSAQTIEASLDDLRQLAERERQRPYAIARLMRLERAVSEKDILRVMRALDAGSDPKDLARALNGQFTPSEIEVIAKHLEQSEVAAAMDKVVQATPGMEKSITNMAAIVRRSQERIDSEIADAPQQPEAARNFLQPTSEEIYVSDALNAFEQRFGVITNAQVRSKLRRAIAVAHVMSGGWRTLESITDEELQKLNPGLNRSKLTKGSLIKVYVRDGSEREVRVMIRGGSSADAGKLIVTQGTLQDNVDKLRHLCREGGITIDQAQWLADEGWVGNDLTDRQKMIDDFLSQKKIDKAIVAIGDIIFENTGWARFSDESIKRSVAAIVGDLTDKERDRLIAHYQKQLDDRKMLASISVPPNGLTEAGYKKMDILRIILEVLRGQQDGIGKSATIVDDSANGGFDFAGTTEKDQIEAINGGLKMSADKSAASLMQGKVTGFKLAIVVLRY